MIETRLCRFVDRIVDDAHLGDCVEEDYAHVLLEVVSSFYYFLPWCCELNLLRDIVICFHLGVSLFLQAKDICFSPSFTYSLS